MRVNLSSRIYDQIITHGVMPYQCTGSGPDFARLCKTGNPKWCTRAARSGNANHGHVLHPPREALALRVELNTVHGSTDTYVKWEAPCNVVVLPCDDPRIVWKYDGTPRQSARPYISGAAPARSCVVKIARRPRKPPTVFAVHPAAWAAKEAGCREPPGDVVAYLNRLKLLGFREELAAELKSLRAGADICVYLADDKP